MPKWGSFDYSDLKELSKRLNDAVHGDLIDGFLQATAEDIAKALLRKVKKRTPVGSEDNLDPDWLKQKGFKTAHGNLRRFWTSDVVHMGNDIQIVISNDMFYASYVEFGHRQTPGRFVPALGKQLQASWVPGQFMLTISVKEVMSGMAPRIIKKNLEGLLRMILEGRR